MGFAYQIVVATTAEKAWKALIDAEFTRQYWFGRTLVSDWKPGSRVEVLTPEGQVEVQDLARDRQAHAGPPLEARLRLALSRSLWGPCSRAQTLVWALSVPIGPKNVRFRWHVPC
jgi:hypothetical protein